VGTHTLSGHVDPSDPFAMSGTILKATITAIYVQGADNPGNEICQRSGSVRRRTTAIPTPNATAKARKYQSTGTPSRKIIMLPKVKIKPAIPAPTGILLMLICGPGPIFFLL
jgi:hypothetical protein